MFWLVIVVLLFVGLHLGLLLATQLAVVAAAVLTIGLWLVWKLRWIILGIIGLEEIFGGRNDGA